MREGKSTLFVWIGTADAARNRSKRTTNVAQAINHLSIPSQALRILRHFMSKGWLPPRNVSVLQNETPGSGMYLKVIFTGWFDADKMSRAGLWTSCAIGVVRGWACCAGGGLLARCSGLSSSITHCQVELCVLVNLERRVDFGSKVASICRCIRHRAKSSLFAQIHRWRLVAPKKR
jgi:hypothetical protein